MKKKKVTKVTDTNRLVKKLDQLGYRIAPTVHPKNDRIYLELINFNKQPPTSQWSEESYTNQTLTQGINEKLVSLLKYLKQA